MEKPTLPDLQLSIKKKPPPSSPFLGRSQYSANFPGYPSAGVFFVKGGRSVHLSNLPFSATSSY